MAKDSDFEKKIKDLREQALGRMSQAQSQIVKNADPEIRRLLHELNVHQIELELQNEELREAQRQLELSRDRYMQLYHHAPVGYIAANSAGIVLQANKTFGFMLDQDIANLLHKPLANLIHPDDREIFFGRFRAFYKNPADKNLEIRMLKANGSVIDTKFEGRRIDPLDAGGASRDLIGHLLISISDVTRRKAAERAIISAKQQWEQTFDAVPDPIAIIDDKFDIVRVNKALADRIGTTPRECVKKKCYQVLHTLNQPCEDCPHKQYTEGRMPVRAEVYNAKLSGHFITTITPFSHDTQSDRFMTVHVYHDISDRKRAENELIKMRNLESIGTLAGGIAHDFNNILTAVVGHIDIAQYHVKGNPKAFQHLAESLHACHRAKELSNRLVTFAEGGAPHMNPVSISRTIEEVIALSLSGTNVDCHLDLADDLRALIIDEAQIKSALQNVINNAREAMPWGGTVIIKARNAQRRTHTGHSINNQNYIRIDISDTGAGIAPSHVDKIFDPYFTTKQMGTQKGMGLGLAITHSIIKQHRGHVEVQSKPGEGTTVTIFLPLSQNVQPERRKKPGWVKGGPMPARKVLFMDDERILWKVVEGMLGPMECQVDFAANADEALSLFQESLNNDAPYAAVILDLTIRGGIGGKEVVQKMLSIDPQVKALAVSGYSSDPVFVEFRHFGFIGALKKPFVADELAAALAQLINVTGHGDA